MLELRPNLAAAAIPEPEARISGGGRQILICGRRDPQKTGDAAGKVAEQTLGPQAKHSLVWLNPGLIREVVLWWGIGSAGRRHGGAGDVGGPAEHQPLRSPQQPPPRAPGRDQAREGGFLDILLLFHAPSPCICTA